MRVKVSQQNALPSIIRSNPDLGSKFKIGSAPVGAEMKVLPCVPEGVSPDFHPYVSIKDDLQGHCWWYVEFRGPDSMIQGWASETGEKSKTDPSTVYYLIPVDECRDNRLERGKTARVTREGMPHFLKLRVGPSTQCDVINGLPSGTSVLLLDDCVRSQGMKWWFVKVQNGDYKEKQGWVSQKFGRDIYLEAV